MSIAVCMSASLVGVLVYRPHAALRQLYILLQTTLITSLLIRLSTKQLPMPLHFFPAVLNAGKYCRSPKAGGCSVFNDSIMPQHAHVLEATDSATPLLALTKFEIGGICFTEMGNLSSDGSSRDQLAQPHNRTIVEHRVWAKRRSLPTGKKTLLWSWITP